MASSSSQEGSSSVTPAANPPQALPNIYQSIMSRPPNSPLSSAHYTAEAALHRPVSLYGSREGRATNNPAGPLLSDCGNINVNNDGGSGNTTSPPIDMTLGALTMRSLPYPQPWSRTNASPGEVPPNFNWLSESCGGKAVSGVIGGE